MTAEQITTIITNVLTSGGVAVFLYMVIRGLKAQIGTLNKTIEVQQKTMEAMETRVLETEKVGNIYKQLVEELPNEIEKYKALLTKLKDDQISELEKANQHKDERLKNTAQIEIEKLELQQRALDDIPKLLGQFTDIARTIDQRLSTVGQLAEVNWFLEGETRTMSESDILKLFLIERMARIGFERSEHWLRGGTELKRWLEQPSKSKALKKNPSPPNNDDTEREP